MGIIKNLFLFNLGKVVSKKHPTAAGMGIVALNTLAENEKEQNKSINKLYSQKEKTLEQLIYLYDNFNEYMGPVFIEKYKRIYDMVNNIEPGDNFNKNQALKYLKECNIHIFAVQTSESLIEQINNVPKGKIKKSIIDNANNMYESIKESVDTNETIDIWNNFMNYLINNGLMVSNYEELKDSLKELCE